MRFQTGQVKYCNFCSKNANLWLHIPRYYLFFFKGKFLLWNCTYLSEFYLIISQDQRILLFLLHLMCREEQVPLEEAAEEVFLAYITSRFKHWGEKLNGPWVERWWRKNCKEYFNSLHPVLKYLPWLQLPISWLLQCGVCWNTSFPKSLSCSHD